jgi:hypothetical protein
MTVEQQIEFADEAAAEQAYADAVAVVVKVQSICIRLEQANEKLEMLQASAGCGSFSELMDFIKRHTDDGK